LRQNEVGVLVENGGICPPSVYATSKDLNASFTAAILHDDDEVPVPDNDKAIFYAQAEFEV
jgi:hypothetical protein